MNRMAPDLLFNNTGCPAQPSRDHGEIDFLNGPRGKLGRQITMGFIVLCDHEAAAGFLVQTMDDTGAFLPADSRQCCAVMEQGIDECVLAVARARMDNHTGRLVDYDEVPVLKKDIERNGLRLILDFFQRRFRKLNPVLFPDEIARPGRLSIQSDGTVAD